MHVNKPFKRFFFLYLSSVESQGTSWYAAEQGPTSKPNDRKLVNLSLPEVLGVIANGTLLSTQNACEIWILLGSCLWNVVQCRFNEF